MDLNFPNNEGSKNYFFYHTKFAINPQVLGYKLNPTISLYNIAVNFERLILSERHSGEDINSSRF